MKFVRSIEDKLTEYLVQKMGFVKEGLVLKKTLDNEADFICPPGTYLAFHQGQIYGGNVDYLYSMLADNYVTQIEDRFDEFLELTDEERAFIDNPVDEDIEDFTGFDVISQWIWDYVEVTVNEYKVNLKMREEIEGCRQAMLDRGLTPLISPVA